MNDHLKANERRIADHLKQQVQLVNVGSPAADEVMRRGDHRRMRRRTGVGVLTTAAVGITAIAGIQILSRDDPAQLRPGTAPAQSVDQTGATTDDTIAARGATPLQLVDADLVWNTVTPDSASALGSNFWDSTVDGTAPYTAWSTAPGNAANDAFVPQLFQSDDGITWSSSGGATSPQVSMRGTGSYGGHLYAFGTAAATAPIPTGGAGDLVIQRSDDLGATWTPTVLPIDLRGLAAMAGVAGVSVDASDLAAGPTGVIATATVNVRFADDVIARFLGSGYAVTPDGLRPLATDCGNVTATTTLGVVVPTVVAADAPIAGTDGTSVEATDSATVPPTTAVTDGKIPSTTVEGPGCIADTPDTSPASKGELSTWSELGVDPAVGAIASAPPRMYFSADGVTFEAIDFPGVPDGSTVGRVDVVAGTDGFIVSYSVFDRVRAEQATLVATSTDGRSWTSLDVPLIEVNTVGRLSGGGIAVVGFATGYRPAAAVTLDGTTWTTVDLSGVLSDADGRSATLSPQASSIGATGIAVVASIAHDTVAEAGGVDITHDGITAHIPDLSGDLVFIDDATGEAIGSYSGSTGAATGARVEFDQNTGQSRYLVLAADGSVRATFTPDDIGAAQNPGGTGTFQYQPIVLHSDDGVRWSRDDLAELTGVDIPNLRRVQVTDSNVVVTVVDASVENPDGTPVTKVLVGTPKG